MAKPPLYLICYDLFDYSYYSNLTQHLQSIGAVQVQLSVWAVRLDNTNCKTLRKILKKLISKKGRIVVVKVASLASYKSISKLSSL